MRKGKKLLIALMAATMLAAAAVPAGVGFAAPPPAEAEDTTEAATVPEEPVGSEDPGPELSVPTPVPADGSDDEQATSPAAGEAESPSFDAGEVNDAPMPPTGSTSVPVPISAPAVTLSDLTKVAEYLAGKTELTPAEEERFDFDSEDGVTLLDLTRLAEIYASEMTENNPPAEPSAELPVADPAYATTRIIGTISSIDEGEDTVYVMEDSPDATDPIGAVEAEDCIIIDCVTGDELTIADLKKGQRVSCYLSSAIMPSLPPKSVCPALIVNVPTEGSGWANYVRVSEIEGSADGGITVLNQNADLLVTIPGDVPIEVLGSDETVPASEIKVGTGLIAWFDMIAESYPGQALALRCVADLDTTGTDVPEDPDSGLPSVDPAYQTVNVAGTISSIDTEDRTVFVKPEDPQAADEIGLIETDHCMVVDFATGAKVDFSSLKEGDRVSAFLGAAMMPSIPPKADCQAIIVNIPAERAEDATYVCVSEVNSRPSGTGISVLNQNADLYVGIPSDLEIEVFGSDETVSADLIQPGARLIVWHDGILETYPMSTTAKRCVIDLTAAGGDDPSAGLPTADPAYQTTRITAVVESVDTAENTVLVKEDAPEAKDELILVPAEDCMVINCETGKKASLADLKKGDRISAFLGAAMMPSIPAKAICPAIITNIPEDSTATADYIRVSEVTNGAINGGVTVLNQNADLYVTIPDDIKIEVYGSDETAQLSDIRDGSRLIVWYDVVALSYPAQTAALRCVIDLSPAPEASSEA